MKNKKYLATLLAASMLMGSSLTVFADDVAITGNTTQEVPMSMTVTAEDLEAAGSLTDVTVRVPARMTLAYKNGGYISTDKVGAFGTLPSYKKVIISNENSDIVFKNTDESKEVTGKLTLGMLNEDLIVSSEELAAGKADANDIKYSQVTAKVNTKNLEDADTFSGTANLKVKIEALTTTENLNRLNLKNYAKDTGYKIWYNTTKQEGASIYDGISYNSGYIMYLNGTSYGGNWDITNFSEKATANENNTNYYKPDVVIYELTYNNGPVELLFKTTLSAPRTNFNEEYNTLKETGIYPSTLAQDFITPFLATPNLDLLILPKNIELNWNPNGNAQSGVGTTMTNKYLSGLYFVKDYDKDNDLFIYIPNISYNGTMEEWNALIEWNFPKMENTVTVYCTDGTITYE